MAKSLVLASGSKIRSELMTNAGIPHDVMPVKIDEEAIRVSLISEGATPRDVADTLAELKAQKAANKHPKAYVLGCDQVLSVHGEILGKASDKEEAKAHLLKLGGSTHTLLSAVVLYHDATPIWRHVGVVRLTMRPLSDHQVESYLDQVWPEVSDAVGCYKLEELGAQLFTNIVGDYFTVLGLPLLPVISILKEHGLAKI